jgi:hypothetical protein
MTVANNDDVFSIIICILSVLGGVVVGAKTAEWWVLLCAGITTARISAMNRGFYVGLYLSKVRDSPLRSLRSRAFIREAPLLLESSLGSAAH